MLRLMRLIALSLLALLLTGCGTHVSIPAWQRSINRYISNEANGDPSVLADLEANGHHPGFTLIGENYTYDSDDARGVLLDHRTLDGQPWFIYLVGMVDHERVDDIRIAVMTLRDRQPHWATSPRARRATDIYRRWNLAQGRSRFPRRKELPAEYRGFPRQTDVFRLETTDAGVISVYHDASGARWQLRLP